MAQKVYESVAEIDISTYLANLLDLEKSTDKTATRLTDIFQQLDKQVSASLTSIEQRLNKVANQLNNTNINQRTGTNQQSTQQAQLQQELTALKKHQEDELNTLRNHFTKRQAIVKKEGAAEFQFFQRDLQQQTAALKKELERQQQIQRQAQQIVTRQNAARTNQSGSGLAGFNQQAYDGAVRAATLAQQKEIALRKKLTLVARQEAQAMSNAIKSGYDDAAEHSAAMLGQRGPINALRAGINQMQTDLQRVEDEWNSIYRAGSQLSQLGGIFSMFAAGFAMIGANVAQSNTDFDFWMRRTIAAVRAANDQMQVTAEEGIVAAETFKDYALEVGRAVGIFDATQIAETWFTYQAALGDTITTTEDLIVSQQALQSILQASIITDTDPTTVIRGVTSVLGQFNLTAQELPYVLSVLTSITNLTAAEFSDLLESFKYVGPQARRLGLDLADLAAVLSSLAVVGIRGTQAGRLFASGLVNLLDPSREMEKALQRLLITSRGLAGDWRDVVFEGGQLRQLFRTINEDGSVTTGLLDEFADAFRNLAPQDRERELATIFGKESGKVWSTLIAGYEEARVKAEASGEAQLNFLDEIAQGFRDPNRQLEAFGDQWEEIAEGTKVQLGIIMFAFEELRERLGTILLTQLLPIGNVIKELVYDFLDWAETHPEVANGLTRIAIGATLLLGVIGPLLAGLGFMVQGIAGLPILATAVSGALGTLGAVFKSVNLAAIASGTAIAGLSAPMLAVIAVLGALYLAWRNDWFGMRDTVANVVPLIGAALKSLVSLFGGALTFITGLISGNNAVMQQGFEDMLASIIEILVVIPAEIVKEMTRSFTELDSFLASNLNILANNMVTWGRNLVVSLANGIIEGTGYLMSQVNILAESIAQFFRGYSPPRYGPLRYIDQWGTNLINTLVGGMEAADFQAVSNIAGNISEALKMNIEDDLFDASDYASTAGLANNLVSDMLEIVKGGGRVTEEFFQPLEEGLGEWYEYVVAIALAYQDVYANERQLQIEQEKLDVIREQREELQKQNDERQSEFDQYLRGTDTSSVTNYSGEIVDPTTPEGKRRIEQLRRELSQEDFQNWINFQKQLWDERAEIEDDNLQQQEEQIQEQVDLYEAQLEAAQKQLDLYEQMYAYAQEMYNLAKDQERLEQQQDQEEAAGRDSLTGSPEDLRQFLQEIAKIIGGDQAVLDEGTLRDNRGGDDIGALGDATRQREREEERLSQLERENRRKRSEFEVQLINATSEEERDQIKKTRDAWDAAYKQEKQRLQERIQLSREVEEAAERQADSSLAGRIGETERRFQREIRDILGEQTGEILDANQLKESAGNLDQAQLTARRQLRTEERDLRDLQAVGDQKKLEFEQRIREAADDPERIRRIEEEQEAWEVAYKQAVEAQQARVEAARRAQQDLNDFASEQRASGGASGGAGGAEGVGLSPGGGIGTPLPDIVGDGLDSLFGDLNQRLEEVSATRLTAIGILDDLKEVIAILGDESLTTGEKLEELAPMIKEWLGYDTWWDALAPEESRAAIQDWFGDLRGLWDEFSLGFSANWDLFWFRVQSIWHQFRTQFLDATVGSVTSIFTGWSTGLQNIISRTGIFNEENLEQWGGLFAAATLLQQKFSGDSEVEWSDIFSTALSSLSVFGVDSQEDWDALFEALGTAFSVFDLAFRGDWSGLWGTLQGVYEEYFKEPFETTWDELWSGLTQAWDDFWGPFQSKYDEFIGLMNSVLDPVVNFVNAISNIRLPSIGGGDDDDGGGRSGGSYAKGLYRVPYDEFPALLHQGERVLTAEEAAVYNSLESTLGRMRTLTGSFQTTANNPQKNTNFSIGKVNVNSSNSQEGMAFLRKWSELS